MSRLFHILYGLLWTAGALLAILTWIDIASEVAGWIGLALWCTSAFLMMLSCKTGDYLSHRETNRTKLFGYDISDSTFAIATIGACILLWWYGGDMASFSSLCVPMVALSGMVGWLIGLVVSLSTHPRAH